MLKEKDYAFRIVKAMNRFDRAYMKNPGYTTKNGYQLILLYALEDGIPRTQKDISEECLIPRTTVNSIVKKYEKEGYIELKHVAGTRREMEICLTESGKQYAKATLSVVHQAEQKAFSETFKEFSPDFVDAYERLAENMEKAFEQTGDQLNEKKY